MRISPASYNAYTPSVSASKKTETASPVRPLLTPAKTIHFAANSAPKKKGFLRRLWDRITGWWNTVTSFFKSSDNKAKQANNEAVEKTSETETKAPTKAELEAQLKKLESEQQKNYRFLLEHKDTISKLLMVDVISPRVHELIEQAPLVQNVFFVNHARQVEVVGQLLEGHKVDLSEKREKLISQSQAINRILSIRSENNNLMAQRKLGKLSEDEYQKQLNLREAETNKLWDEILVADNAKTESKPTDK